MGNPSGYRSVHGREAGGQYHPNEDGGTDDVQQAQGSQERKEQERADYRRLRQRQDPLSCETEFNADERQLCCHRSKQISIIRL